MRLIDADVLSEYIKEEIKQDRPDDFKIRNIQRIIEDTPIAYDVENVVERLNTMYDDYDKMKKNLTKNRTGKTLTFFHTQTRVFICQSIL